MEEAQKLFGDRLRALRKSKNLSQEAFSEIGDFNPKYYGAIERGEVNPTLDTIVRLAEALDINIGDLLAFDLQSRSPEAEEVVSLLLPILKQGQKKKLKKIAVFLKHIV